MAFTADGELVLPTQYSTALPGAIVEIDISFVHFLIGKTRTTFVADVREITILREPQALPQIPTKKRLMAAASGGEGGSNAKKQRT